MELCFAELRQFDRKGVFLGKHPFIAHHSERERLQQLLAEDPVAFTEEMHRVRLNISRYQSHLNSKKFNAEQKKREQTNLDKHTEMLALYEEILRERINGKH